MNASPKALGAMRPLVFMIEIFARLLERKTRSARLSTAAAKTVPQLVMQTTVEVEAETTVEIATVPQPALNTANALPFRHRDGIAFKVHYLSAAGRKRSARVIAVDGNTVTVRRTGHRNGPRFKRTI